MEFRLSIKISKKKLKYYELNGLILKIYYISLK